jgi:hypothetical protein
MATEDTAVIDSQPQEQQEERHTVMRVMLAIDSSDFAKHAFKCKLNIWKEGDLLPPCE